MSRNLKLLVFAGVFVILLVLFLVFGNKLSQPTETTTPTQSLANLVDEVQLISLTQSDVQTIQIDGDVNLTAKLVDAKIEEQITSEDGTRKRQTSDGKRWESSDFDVDQASLNDIARVGSALKSKRLISEKPEDPSVYGLSTPYRTVTLATADGRSFTVEIGSLTPTEDARYVKMKGTDTIYTVDKYAIEALAVDALALRNTVLYPVAGMTEDNVTALTFYRGGEEIFSAQNGATIQEWSLSYPMKWEGDYEDLWPVLQALAGVSFESFEDLKTDDLAKYGLDVPKYQFNYTLDGQKYVLKLGNKKPESPYFYAMADGLDGVLLLATSTMSFVDKPATDFMYPFVFLPTIYDATKMVFQVDGRTDEMLFNVEEGADGVEEISFNGRSMTTDEELKMAKRYYQGAIGFLFDAYDLEAKPSGKSVISVEYWLENNPEIGNHMLVEFIPTPEASGYYAMKNGEYTGLIVGNRKMETALESIREGYDNLIAELAKTPAN